MRPPYSRTLFGLLREQAERFPERIALICGERQATYRDLADGAGRVGYEAFRASAARFDPLAPGEGASADDALILYTSGSSARPKAVRLQHHAIIANGFAIGERMGLSPDDRVLLAPPLFWAYGACNALPATLTHGAALVLQARFEPGEWIGLVERHRVTAVYTLPSITGPLFRHPEFRRQPVPTL